MSQTKSRVLSYDILRILAACSVVLLHCAAQFWYTDPVTEWNWKVDNAYDAVSRIGVPLFVMISGALLLGTKEAPSAKKLFTGRILRMAIIYVFWNAVYGLYSCSLWGFSSLSLKEAVKYMVNGSYHLWYLPMLCGLYALTPILHELVHKLEKRTLEYYFLLFLLFQILRTTAAALFVESAFWQTQFGQLEIPMICSYISYYLLGFYLAEYGLSESWLHRLAWGILPAALLNILGSCFLSLRLGNARAELFDSFSLGTAWLTIAIFCLVTQRFSGRMTQSRLIAELSQDTFGVYLMHILVIHLVSHLGIHSQMIPNVLGIPLLALISFSVSLCAAALLRRLPRIGKYLC